MANIGESLHAQDRIAIDHIPKQSTAWAQVITLLLETLSSPALQTPHSLHRSCYPRGAPAVPFASPFSSSLLINIEVPQDSLLGFFSFPLVPSLIPSKLTALNAISSLEIPIYISSPERSLKLPTHISNYLLAIFI